MHGRYADGYMAIRGFIHDSYKPGTPIIVGGYSQGGGLAPICALDMQYNFNPPSIECIVLNAPRVFNKAGQESYNKRVPNTQRYVWGNDIVSKAPPTLFGFRHIGTEKHFGPKKEWWKFNIEDHTQYMELISRVEE